MNICPYLSEMSFILNILFTELLYESSHTRDHAAVVNISKVVIPYGTRSVGSCL